MSKSIDERIVQMQFDNKQFESGASQTIGTLEKLKNALKFDKSSGLSDLQTSVNKFNFGPMADAIDKISSRFSALGIVAITVLQNITNKAIEAGEQLVKSLSLDQIEAGFAKYEEATANVQTLINATGKSQEQIYEYLDKLMWYSDETSYAFTDMTSALSTMTSVGGDIESLIPLLEGVANATAYAGKGAAEYGRIMQYAITQAYSMGALTYQDWKTIQNMGVGSVQLQKELIKAGEELGTLQKGVVKAGENFTMSIQAQGAKDMGLNYKWITKEVMEKAFGNFAKVTDEIYKGIQDGTFDNYAEGLEAIGKKYGEVAYQAAKSAQEAKTFKEAMDATKDAVSSKWMKFFETIFGKYQDAVDFWTWLTNEPLYETFVTPLDRFQGVLEGWAEGGGRDILVQAFENIWEDIQSVMDPIKEAFREIFPAKTSEDLIRMTEKFKELTEKMKLSSETAEKVKGVFKTVFAGLKVGADIFKVIAGAVTGAIEAVVKFVGGPLASAVGAFGDWVIAVKDALEAHDLFAESAQFVQDALEGILTKIGEFIPVIVEKVKGMKDSIKEFFTFDDGFTIGKLFDKIKEAATSAFEKVKNIVNNIKENLNIDPNFKILDAFEKLKDGFVKVWEKIKEVGTKISDYLKELFGNLDIGDVLKGAGFLGLVKASTSLTEAVNNFSKAFKTINESMTDVTAIGNSATAVLDTVRDALATWKKSVSANIVIKIAIALGILAASLYTLANMPREDLEFAFGQLTAMLVELMGAVAIINVINVKKGSTSKISMIIALALSLNKMVSAMKKMGSMNEDEFGRGIVGLYAVLAGIAGFLFAFKHINFDLSDSKWGSSEKKMLAFSISFTIICSALSKVANVVVRLGSLEWMEIAKGFSGLAALFTELLIFMAITKKIDLMEYGNPMNFVKLAASFYILVHSVQKLADVATELGKLSVEELLKGILSVGTLLSLITVVLGEMNTRGVDLMNPLKLMGTFASFLFIVKAIEKLVPVLFKLGLMRPKVLIEGIAGIGTIMAEIAAFLIVMRKFNVGASTSSVLKTVVMFASFEMIVDAITKLQPTIQSLATMEPGQYAKALGGLAIILTEIGVFMAAMTAVANTAGSLKTLAIGATFMMLGQAIGAISSAVEKLGNLSSKKGKDSKLSELGKGLAGLAIGLGIVVAAAYLVTPIIGEFIAFAASLLAVGAACELFGKGVQWIADGFKSITETIRDNLSGIGEELELFTESMMVCLDELAFGIPTALASFASGIVLGFAEIGAAIMTGVFDVINTVQQGVADVITTALNNIINIINSVSGVIESAANMFSGGIEAIMKMFEDIGKLDYDSVANGVNALCMALLKLSGTLAVLGVLSPLIIAASVAIAAFAGAIAALIGVAALVIGALYEIKTHFGDITEQIEKIVESVQKFFEGVGETISNFFKGIGEDIKGFFEGIGEAFKKAGEGVSNALKSVHDRIDELKEAIHTMGDDLLSWASSIGYNIIKGIADGIVAAGHLLWNAIGTITRGVKTRTENDLKIKSPSRVFRQYGLYIDEGLALGIRAGESTINKSIDDMTSALTESVKDQPDEFYAVGSQFGRSMTDGMNSYANSASLKPVLDIDESSINTLSLMKKFSDSIRDSLASVNDISTEQTINEHITFDPLRIEGVNNEQEFVAVTDYAIEDIVTRIIRREART